AIAFNSALTARNAAGMRLRIATGIVTVFLGILFVLALRWLRRQLPRWGLWRPQPFPGTIFYQRLLAVLARRGLQPAAAQTPREFAETVALSLTGRDNGAALGDIVRRSADLFYRVRFGAHPLSPEETREVNAQIGRLAAALASG